MGKKNLSDTKISNIRKLRGLGLPVREVARLTGVSTVTVYDYTVPGFYEERLKKSRDYLRRTVLATGATKQGAVTHKHLDKRPHPGHCEICGRTDQMLYYHHWDDSNLNLGIWVCFKHHRLAELVDEKGPRVIVGLMATYERLRKEIELAEIDKENNDSKSKGENQI